MIENLIARDAIKRKSARNTQNRTRQTHRRSNLICLTKVNLYVRDAIKRRAIGKSNPSNYAQSEDHQIQIG